MESLVCHTACPLTLSPGIWISSFALCTSAPGSLSVIDAHGVRYSPVLADTDQYSACISLARCTASASACSHAAPDWKKQPWADFVSWPSLRALPRVAFSPHPCFSHHPSKWVWWGVPGQGCCLPRADTEVLPREVRDPCPLQLHNPIIGFEVQHKACQYPSVPLK